MFLGSIVNAARPLALVLAVLGGCVALASAWPGLSSWTASLPAETAEGATSRQSCVDDVSVTVDAVWEGFTYTLAVPPDYADGDDIWIAYTVTNNSCSVVTVTVALTGSVSGATIHDADGSTAPCADGCNIPAGSPEYGTVLWNLGKHPNATSEKVVATITIDAPSDFNDTDTSNNSATSSEFINIVNEASTVDIGVKSVTPSKTSALIGDDIDFTVVIENEGDSEADATVTLDYGADSDTLGSDEVTGLTADGESTVTLSWDTDGAEAGEHSLRVLVAADGDSNTANDSKTVTITLREPSTDVAVTGVKPSATDAIIGDTVDFTVSLENDGDVAVAPSVALYAGNDTEALGSVTAATIAVSGTATVTISWDTTGAKAGTYSLSAVATVAGDDDATNDSATAAITLHDPVDVKLSLTSPIADAVVGGNSLNVPFTVTNAGDNDTGQVTVSLYVTEVGQDQETEDATTGETDGEEEEEEEAPTATFSLSALAVDASASDTLTWDTADANVGDYDILLVAATNGDTDQTNNSVEASVEIRNWLVLKSVSPEDTVAIAGDAVTLTAQVENVGSDPLAGVTVGLYEANVASALATATISSVAVDGSATATIEWDTTGREAEALDLLVAAGATGQDPDRDDSQWISVDLRNPIALSSAALASTDNIAGLPVAINVRVRNESDAEVTDVTVDLFVGTSEAASSTAEIESIPAGETIDASLTWDTANAAPDAYRLNVVISSADYNGDSNDNAMLDVELRASVMAVALTAAAVNRNVATIGQTLEVIATITNNGEAPVTAPVALYLAGRLQQTEAIATGTSPLIAPGSSSEVMLRWDTTGADVGTHTLKIVAELPADTTTDNNEGLLEIELFRSAFDGSEGVESCLEDVHVKVTDIRDLSDQKRSPPNYSVGEQLKAAYSVYNYSCQTDLALALSIKGPEDHVISDASALCISNCVVPYGGKVEGEIAWSIPTLPALSDQAITAAITIVSPSDFVDANEANNSNASTDQINIVHPDDVVLRLEEQTGDKVSTRRGLTGPEFGVVDVRLVSASPSQTTLPFAASTVEFVVAAANDGPGTEPATVRFIVASEEGKDPQELRRHTMVIPAGQTQTANLDVPMTGVLPGARTVEVLLSAAIDRSRENDAATVEITRLGPTIAVEMADVSVAPDVLILGDDATVSLTVQNDSEIALPLNLELYVDDESEPVVTKTLAELAPGSQSQEQIDWSLPATAGMLGAHTLKLVASSEEFGAVATAVAEVSLHINAEIISINSSPIETAMQGEEVAIQVEARNNGPSAVNVPVTLHFPSDDKLPETLRPRLGPGETGTAGFVWRTRDYAVGEHTLTATVPEQHNITDGATLEELPFRLTEMLITAAIVDVTAYPEAPSVGEPVAITVTVRNDGPIAANIPITLHYPAAGKRPETRSPRVDPGQTGTATFNWLTSNYAAGTHRFVIEVAAVDSPQQRFMMDLLPTVENAAVVAMGTYPVETAMVGEPVEVWIDVRNDGPVALNVPVRLTFPSASKAPETRSPRVGPGETARVTFTWKTSNYDAGIHTLRAAILLNSNVTVGQTSAELRFTLTPLVISATIVNISVNPDEPRIGDPVTITVTVRNDGRVAANIPVTLHFPSGEKLPETRSPRVEPGAVKSASFEWRTGHYEPGIHSFRAEAAGDPPSSQRFEITLLPPIVNVAIVGVSSDPAETAVRGQTVKVWVDVINNGPLALNVPVQLTFPSDEKKPEVKSPRIEPGETARVEFTWKTSNYGTGIHTLTVTLLAEYNTTELDTSATIQIRLRSSGLAASIIDVSWSPEDPVVGEPVAITIVVRNNGPVTSSIPVTLYFPSANKQPETRRPRVAPGGVGSAVFEWRTSRYEPGEHVFRVQIPGVPGAVKEFVIELLPPAVDFAVIEFHTPDPLRPILKGDWVQLTAVVQNRGPYAGSGAAYLLNAANPDDAMYEQSASLEPGESRRLEFTWKTLRYPAAEYELLVRVEAEHDADPDNDESNHARVHLLTDRDITVGFGSDVRPAVFARPTSSAALAAAPQYSNDIQVNGVDRFRADSMTGPASILSPGVVPEPSREDHDPARMYWQWRSVQDSPWECARFQQAIGESLPRAVVCPQAPALVR